MHVWEPCCVLTWTIGNLGCVQVGRMVLGGTGRGAVSADSWIATNTLALWLHYDPQLAFGGGCHSWDVLLTVSLAKLCVVLLVLCSDVRDEGRVVGTAAQQLL
jgi:hypothetical protein